MQCKICQTPLKNKNAKTCSSSKCKSKWKLERNKQLTYKKDCKFCGGEFTTSDKRSNFCSTKCKSEQTKQTNVQRYGCRNTALDWQISASEEQIRSANEKKSLNSAWHTKKDEILKKRNQANLEKHGTVCTFNLEHSIQKRKQTVQDKYGTKSVRIAGILNANEIPDFDTFADNIIAFIEAKQLNPFSRESLEALKDQYDISPQVVETVLQKKNRRDLVNRFKSSAEISIYKFLMTIFDESEIMVNARPKFMEGSELDFWIPSHNFAIEFHGLAHHSERPIFGEVDLRKVKTQHETKYKLCERTGVLLMQIFEDEWYEKRTILESMIRQRSGVLATRLMARKTQVVEMDVKQANELLDAWHIAGGVGAKKALALMYEDEAVSVMTLRKPWQNRKWNVDWEIARFANKLNVSVAGGFTKLLSRVEGDLLTYADCRFGSGEVYSLTGFEHVGKTKPNYFYEKNGIRENRFKHRKQKGLEGATEREQQNKLGWYAIYDAGSEIYLRRS